MNKKPDNSEKVKRRKTIVIFGISSFVGSNLAEFFKKDYKVVGTFHKTSVSIPGVLTVPCDVLAKEEVQLVLFAFKPDITIYCVGISSLIKCAKNDELADALNTSGLFNVAEYCQRYKSQICYISSAFVFGGESKKYLEMDIPDATTVYGKTQAAAEFYIQKTSLNYVIFRVCKLYGRSLSIKNPTWFENLQRSFKNIDIAQCDDFVKTGYLDVYYLAMIMKVCFEKEVQNRLFQVSSEDVVSSYEFAKKYATIFSENINLIAKAKWPFPTFSSQGGGATSNTNFKLDVGNIGGFLNIKLPSVEESINFTFSRFNGEKRKISNSKKGDGVTFV